MERTKKLEEYNQYLYQKELSKGPREIYVRQAKALLDFLGERDITKQEIMDYKHQRSQEKFSASTLNLYLVAANCYLKYAGHEECVISIKRIQRRKRLENVISVKEYKQMLAYAKESGREKYYYIMRTLALTGIRISELKFFTAEALKQEVITVNNKGKIREVYPSDELRKELLSYCKQAHIEAGVIFRGNKEQAISRVGVYKMLVHMADMLGIPKEKARPHSFRHLFAVTYMSCYANLPELSDLLGHSSLETTRIYTTATVQEIRKKLDEMGL